MTMLSTGLVLLAALFGGALSMAIDEQIRKDPDLSEFLALLERSDGANYSLNNRPITIFAPINQAFQVYGPVSGDPNQLVLYHIANVPRTIDELGTSYASINTEVEGNPPVWVTHTSGNYHNDIYVNNARVLVSQSNQRFHNPKGNDQILHKIDEVLVMPRSPKDSLYNPSALDFMESYEKLIMHPHRLRAFRQRIKQTGREDVYKIEGGHTFFIPVDEGFRDKPAGSIDERIIDAHIIPKRVLFTAPTRKDHPYDTLANIDSSIRVMISFTQENRGPNNVIHYVKSHTLLTNGKYTLGVVLSEIVKANIPVKNGVVHLIQKPLMLVDNNVRQLLEEQMDFICNIGNKKMEEVVDDPYHLERDGGILSSFVKALNDVDYKEFYNTLERSHDVTLFAPCNNAWTDDYTLNSILSNKNRFKDILKMHLVPDNRLYTNSIVQIANQQDKRVHTIDPRNDLYFNVITSGPNRTMTVEAGGVNATVIQPDLAATNGIIHIIDRVLGIPYTTVLDKLRTDYSLNYTYSLGKFGGFNNQLNDTTKKFTYFVPRNHAWEEAGVDHPSAVKKLFMPEFHYHANNILERHLVISDQPYTMERIKQLSTPHNENHYGQRTEVQLPTIRGELGLFVEESNDHAFIIHWKGERIPVFRPNVACTNGIIHVIDAPFLQEGDIQVSGAVSLHFAPHVFMITMAKWLLM